MFARTCLRNPLFKAPGSTGKLRKATSFQIFRMASTLPRLPIFEAIAGHDPESIAVIHSNSGRRFRYGELLHDVVDARNKLQKQANTTDLAGQRVAFLIENGYDYVGARREQLVLLSGLSDNA